VRSQTGVWERVRAVLRSTDSGYSLDKKCLIASNIPLSELGNEANIVPNIINFLFLTDFSSNLPAKLLTNPIYNEINTTQTGDDAA
jgi:hypothetical protein